MEVFMIKERLAMLRGIMQEKGLEAYIIPTADYHQSEYVGEYFTARQFMSGFTGSAGTLVVTLTKAGLWTDGRYYIQAARQLKDSTIELFRQGEDGVPSVEEFLLEEMTEGSVLGFDGKVISASLGDKLSTMLKAKKIVLSFEEDLVHLCWKDRPSLSKESVYVLESCYTGECCSSKLARIKEEMNKIGATMHVVTALDDIAWILNLRGNDVRHNPVFLSYLVISNQETVLFIEEEKLDDKVRAYLSDNGVMVKGYDEVYTYLSSVSVDEKVMLDKNRVNYLISTSLKEGIKVYNEPNPSMLMKAIKNETEIENLKKAHIKDGLAVTRFMYWLKKNIGQIPITELSASEYLEDLRKEDEGYLAPSFDTICAYKENAAMMHYSATKDSFATLKPEGLLLVDSGGQYYEGTTDITRTFALGEVGPEQKKHFTAVVNSMLNLANAKFLYGCTGLNLDILARGPIWDLDIDYKCGTGHGVGYLLNVHEAPNGFRWKVVPERNDSCILEAGMVTTDEPGVYIEGSHGIRIENELVCRQGVKNEYGQFMYFDTITLAPIDLDALDPSYMNASQKERLNRYHKFVYETLSPLLSEEEAVWLKSYTRGI